MRDKTLVPEKELREIAKIEAKRFDDIWRGRQRTKMSMPEKLKTLGITREDVVWAMDFFGPRGSTVLRMRYCEVQKKPDPNGWFQWKTGGMPNKNVPWGSEHTLLDHFLQRSHIVATNRYALSRGIWCEEKQIEVCPPGVVTDQVIIDLDNHGEDPDNDLMERHSKILDASLVEPVVFRSSSSGGLHLLWAFGQSLPLVEVRCYISEVLRRLDIEERPGNAEVYPTEKGHLRVPLGAQSDILDPRTLQPVAETFAEKFRFMREQIVRQEATKSEPFDTENLMAGEDDDEDDDVQVTPRAAEAAEPPPPRRVFPLDKGRPSRGPVRPRHGGAKLAADADVNRMIYESGLSREWTRFESIPRVVRHLYYSIGVTEPERMKAAMWTWITEKHNNASDRFLVQPENVRKDIERVVDKHFHNVESGAIPVSAGRRQAVERDADLSDQDRAHIDRLVDELADAFGDDVPRRKILVGLTSLFAYVLRRCGRRDRPTVEIPAARLSRSLRGWGHSRSSSPLYYKRWMKILEEHRILTSHSRHYTKGKCRRYRLHYDFRG